MATVSVDIPNAVAARVGDAFVAQYPPPAGVDVSTAAARLAYVKSRLAGHVRDVVRAHEAAVAAAAAGAAAVAKADAEINPT